jgi:cell division protein ZapB
MPLPASAKNGGKNHSTVRNELTPDVTPSIVRRVTLREAYTVPSYDLETLERQVEELIRTCRQLRDENTSLRARQDHLVAERAELIEKTELARSRVESMITRLKSMEEGI